MIGPWSLVTSGLLLPASPHIMPVAWTLTLELAFYTLFALAYALGGLRAVVVALAGWYLLTVLHRAGLILAYPDAWRIVHSIVLEFLFGVAIGWAYIRGRLPFAGPALALGAALTVAHFAAAFHGAPLELPREFARGVPAALLVYGAVTLRLRVPRALVLGGEASYAQYLLHGLVLSVAGRAASDFAGFDAFANDFALVLIFGAVVMVSIAATILLERPYEAWRRRSKKRGMARPGLQCA
jgi:peptidoglycan/LPS O-acetylase OafA/YrhL